MSRSLVWTRLSNRVFFAAGSLGVSADALRFRSSNGSLGVVFLCLFQVSKGGAVGVSCVWFLNGDMLGFQSLTDVGM